MAKHPVERLPENEFHIEKDRDNFLGWLLIEAAARLPQSELEKAMESAPPDLRKRGIMKISLTINGIELPARSAIERLAEAFDEEVQKKAEELVRERIGQRMEIFTAAADRAAEMLQVALRGEQPTEH